MKATRFGPSMPGSRIHGFCDAHAAAIGEPDPPDARTTLDSAVTQLSHLPLDPDAAKTVAAGEQVNQPDLRSNPAGTPSRSALEPPNPRLLPY